MKELEKGNCQEPLKPELVSILERQNEEIDRHTSFIHRIKNGVDKLKTPPPEDTIASKDDINYNDVCGKFEYDLVVLKRQGDWLLEIAERLESLVG